MLLTKTEVRVTIEVTYSYLRVGRMLEGGL